MFVNMDPKEKGTGHGLTPATEASNSKVCAATRRFRTFSTTNLAWQVEPADGHWKKMSVTVRLTIHRKKKTSKNCLGKKQQIKIPKICVTNITGLALGQGDVASLPCFGLPGALVLLQNVVQVDLFKHQHQPSQQLEKLSGLGGALAIGLGALGTGFGGSRRVQHPAVHNDGLGVAQAGPKGQDAMMLLSAASDGEVRWLKKGRYEKMIQTALKGLEKVG